MAIQLLATLADVEKRLKRKITDAEDVINVNNMIEEASVRVRSYLGCGDLPQPIPEDLAVIVSRIVARGISAQENPTADVGQNSLTANFGPFGLTRSFDSSTTDGGVWLTRQDKDALRPFSCRGRVGNVSTT